MTQYDEQKLRAARNAVEKSERAHAATSEKTKLSNEQSAAMKKHKEADSQGAEAAVGTAVADGGGFGLATEALLDAIDNKPKQKNDDDDSENDTLSSGKLGYVTLKTTDKDDHSYSSGKNFTSLMDEFNGQRAQEIAMTALKEAQEKSRLRADAENALLTAEEIQAKRVREEREQNKNNPFYIDPLTNSPVTNSVGLAPTPFSKRSSKKDEEEGSIIF